MYLYFLFFLQLSYFYLINDILFNSTKENYFNFSVYVNLIKLILPKILKQIFKNKKNIPKDFIQTIDEIFKIWKDKWEIFDNKYSQGLFIYTYNYGSYYNIEEYYSKYIKNEINKFSDNIEKLYKNDSQKIKLLGFENGLDTDCDFSEIIVDLEKIKRMELIISLSKDIDGNEYEGNQISEKETSKIQRILKSMNENYTNNNDYNYKNNINNENKNKDVNSDLDLDDRSKTLHNEEVIIASKKSNDNFYSDLDGEPL